MDGVYSGTSPMLHQQSAMRPMQHYSNPGSVPGSQPFTPTMSEPQSGLMTPRSEFELPLDFNEYSHPGSGFHSGQHSGIHTPNHPHSGVHTPNHPHSGVHTPNHYPYPAQSIQPVTQSVPPPPQLMSSNPYAPQQAMGPGYYRVQQTSYNPPSPALMDTGSGWLDTDL